MVGYLVTVWMEMRHGKLYFVHSVGYIAFTWEEWQVVKNTGDDLFGHPDAIPGERVSDEMADADRRHPETQVE